MSGYPSRTPLSAANTAITYSSNSCCQYSTTVLETNATTSKSSLIEDTLSMVSSPWSKESWNVKFFSNYESSSLSSLIGRGSSASIATVYPESSTSYGVSTASLVTDSTALITLLNDRSPFSDSQSISQLTTRNNSPSDTYSSWTVQTFSATGLRSTDSKIIRPYYPWSPNTGISGTDIYPSTIDSLNLHRVSSETITFTNLLSREELGHVSPLCYTGLTKRKKPVLDWIRVKLKGTPVRDLPNLIAV